MSASPIRHGKAFQELNAPNANKRARFNRDDNVVAGKIKKGSKSHIKRGFDVIVDVKAGIKGNEKSSNKSTAKLNSEVYKNFLAARQVKSDNPASLIPKITSMKGGDASAQEKAPITRQGHSLADAISKRGKFAPGFSVTNPQAEAKEPKAKTEQQPITIDPAPKAKQKPDPEYSVFGEVGRVRILNIKHKHFDANNLTGGEKSMLNVASFLESNRPDYVEKHKSKLGLNTDDEFNKNNAVNKKDKNKDVPYGLSKKEYEPDAEISALTSAKIIGDKPVAQLVTSGNSSYANRQDQMIRTLKSEGLLV